ncbi:hypothetical protein ES705_23144 [subsurface metagenome]
MLMTPEGNYVSWPSMKAVTDSGNNIKEVQIIQNKIDEIIVKIVKLENFNKYDLNLLIDGLKERLGNGLARGYLRTRIKRNNRKK